MEEYYISVSSPFDFDSPDGQNIIKGSLMKVMDRHCVIFKSNYPIELQNTVGSILILLSRYTDNGFDNSMRDIDCWPATVHILKSNSYENMDRAELLSNSKYVILGALEHKKS